MIRNAIKQLTRTSAIVAVLASGIWSGLAAAETPNSRKTPQATADFPSSSQTPLADQGEILVTATRRPEPLQKVPIAVSVVDGERLSADNTNNWRDIARIVPPLSFRSATTSRGQALALRGVGTISASPGVEPSVSTVIDGVVFARQGQAVMDILDIDHVEVLRGPQGTLFGKNASAGVLNIVTKTPGDEVHHDFDLGYYGGGGEWRIGASVSGPIVPGKLAASLTGFSGHYNGNVRNVWNGDIVNGYSRSGVRSKLAFAPSEAVKIQLIADYAHIRDTAPSGVVTSTTLIDYPTGTVSTFPAFAAALAPVVASPENREINVSYGSREISENWGISGQVDLEIGELVLTSISAYRHWTRTIFQDQGMLPQALAGFPQEHDLNKLAYHQCSEELRLASPKGGFIDYQLGLYYFQGVDDETFQRDTTLVAGTSSQVVSGNAAYGTTNTSVAGFGEANLQFTNRLSGTAGLRFTHDRLNYDFNRISPSQVPVPGIPTSFTSSGKTETTGVSARVSLQYNLGRRVMTYFTYGRGYKGPAYNLVFALLPKDALALKPETSNAFEIGLKSRAFSGAVLFNVAAFLDTFKNFQVNFFDVYNGFPVLRFINAGQVSTRGVEADLTAKLGRALTLNGSFAYTDAHVDNFICPPTGSSACNVNGKPLPFAPKWKGFIRASYLVPISDRFDIRLTTDASAQSEVQYSISQTPTTVQPGYGLWNAEIALVAHEGWELNFIVKNIANKSYSPFLSAFGGGVERFVPRDDKRYVGVNFRMDLPPR